MFSGIIQANKGQWVIAHEHFPVKNSNVHKTMIQLVVLERHPAFICKGNRDFSFINSSRKWRGSPIFYREGRFPQIISYFPYYKGSQSIIYGFVLYLWFQQVWTWTSLFCNVWHATLQYIEDRFEKPSNRAILNHLSKQMPYFFSESLIFPWLTWTHWLHANKYLNNAYISLCCQKTSMSYLRALCKCLDKGPGNLRVLTPLSPRLQPDSIYWVRFFKELTGKTVNPLSETMASHLLKQLILMELKWSIILSILFWWGCESREILLMSCFYLLDHMNESMHLNCVSAVLISWKSWFPNRWPQR